MAPLKIASDKPLAEITLRKYEKPNGIDDERTLIKKICLSLGLLQPGDTRDSIVDILLVILKSDKPLSAVEIEERVKEERKKRGLPIKGLAPSNIRRQILRLRKIFIVEKIKNQYRINEGLTLSEIFEEKIERYFLESIKERVKEYLALADKILFESAKNQKEIYTKMEEER